MLLMLSALSQMIDREVTRLRQCLEMSWHDRWEDNHLINKAVADITDI